MGQGVQVDQVGPELLGQTEQPIAGLCDIAPGLRHPFQPVRLRFQTDALGELLPTGGIVTLEDLVESLLGEEIVDESDTVEDMRALARERSEAKRREREQQRKLEEERAADEAQATDDPSLETDAI